MSRSPRPSRAEPASPSRYDKAPRWRRREELAGASYCFMIYRPRDFSGYVLRAFAVEPLGLAPMEYVTAGSLDYCRAMIPPQANKRLARAPDDVAALIEIWH